MADHLSTTKRIEQILTKPFAAALITWGLSTAMGEGIYNINFGPLGDLPLPVGNALIAGVTTAVTEPIGDYLMPYITPHFAVSNGVFLPIVSGVANYMAVSYYVKGYNEGYQPLVTGALGFIGAQYVEDNILMKI